MSHVTMDDVAKAVGVNKGTVSRALRGDSRISPKTRERVWKAAKELGYQLDAVAKGLSSKFSDVVGIAVENMDVPWLGAFLGAAEGVLARSRLEALIMHAGSESVSIESVSRRCRRRKLDGLIWFGEKELYGLGLEVPVVRVGDSSEGCSCRVGLAREYILSDIKSLAGGNRVVYMGSDGAMMPFLAGLRGKQGENAAACADGGRKDFIIWDGNGDFSGEKPSLVCGDTSLAYACGAYSLGFPARELGVLSARLLVNAIRGRGSRPAVTLVKAPLYSASGEPMSA